MKESIFHRAITNACLAASLALAFTQPAAAVDLEDIGKDVNAIVDAHTVCRVVTNRNEKSVMVPTLTASEWSNGTNSFLASEHPGVEVRDCDFRMKSITSYLNGDYCGADFAGNGWCWWGMMNANSTPSGTPRRVNNMVGIDNFAMGWQVNCADADGKTRCVSASDYANNSATGLMNTGIKDIHLTYDSQSSGRGSELGCGILLNDRGIKCLTVQGYYPPNFTYNSAAPITAFYAENGVGCFVESKVLKCFRPMMEYSFVPTIRTVNGAPNDIADILWTSLNDIVVQDTSGRVLFLSYDGEVKFTTFRYGFTYPSGDARNYPTSADWGTAAFSYERAPTQTKYITGFTNGNPRLGATWAFARLGKKDLSSGHWVEEPRTNTDSTPQACGAVSDNTMECRNYAGNGNKTVFPSITIPNTIKSIAGTEDYYINRPNSMCILDTVGGVWCQGEGISNTLKLMQFR